jgi:hypothetical protein
MKFSLMSVFITTVSVAIITVASFLFVVSLLLGLTAANIVGVVIFVFTGVAAKIGIRIGSWNWVSVAGIALTIGWMIIYSSNIDIL